MGKQSLTQAQGMLVICQKAAGAKPDQWATASLATEMPEGQVCRGGFCLTGDQSVRTL